jgi:phage shock protein C
MNTTQLFRSRENRIIAGVAGGVAEYFKTDVSLIRLLWIFAIFCWGGGLLVYLIAWAIVPERSSSLNKTDPGNFTTAASVDSQEKTTVEDSTAYNPVQSRPNGSHTIGFILIGLGLLLLFKTLFPWQWSRYIGPMLIILGGVWLLIKPKKA